MNANIRMAGVVTLLGIAPGAAHAAEVKIDNVTNNPIYVAVAYKNWNNRVGNNRVGVEGWFVIESNKSRTFTAPDASDMYIRVQNHKGKEINWKSYKTYDTWAVSGQPFEMSQSSLNKKVRVYRWGPKLENNHNSGQGDPAPDGFDTRRFFRIGSGKHALDLLP